MADIKVLHREESSLALLENGTAGDGGLSGGELGYTDAAGVQEFSLKKRAGGFAHILSRERLALAAAAATAGAVNIGYYPVSPLTADNVQDALDELAGLVGGGGGGTLLGSGTAGRLTKWLNSTTVEDSDILSEASGKLLFEGDTDATLYRSAAGTLKTDGSLFVAGEIDCETLDVSLNADIDGSLGVTLSAGIGGDLGVGGDIDVVGRLNALGALIGNQSLTIFGVGADGDANTEYVSIGHNGGNAFITVGKSGTGAYHALHFANSATALHAMHENGNIGWWNTANDFGSGVGIMRLHDRTTAPTSNAAAGGFLYAESGALKWRGSGGTVTTIAPA